MLYSKSTLQHSWATGEAHSTNRQRRTVGYIQSQQSAGAEAAQNNNFFSTAWQAGATNRSNARINGYKGYPQTVATGKGDGSTCITTQYSINIHDVY